MKARSFHWNDHQNLNLPEVAEEEIASSYFKLTVTLTLKRKTLAVSLPKHTKNRCRDNYLGKQQVKNVSTWCALGLPKNTKKRCRDSEVESLRKNAIYSSIRQNPRYYTFKFARSSSTQLPRSYTIRLDSSDIVHPRKNEWTVVKAH